MLAWAHLRRRPLAVTGVFDGVMLAAAVSGLAVVGPLALLVPVTGGSPWSWPVLAFLFALCVAVCVLVSRPRMVVYNITVEQFRPLVAEVVSSLDPKARWAGESAPAHAASLARTRSPASASKSCHRLGGASKSAGRVSEAMALAYRRDRKKLKNDKSWSP